MPDSDLSEDSSTKNDRHNARMQRKKAVVDAKIESAGIAKGLLLIHTGNGKGKSTEIGRAHV